MTTVYERYYDMTPEGRIETELDAANEAGNRLMDAYNALAAELATTRDALIASAQRAEAADNRAAELAEELDALKAAAEWRPGSETPPAPGWYQTVETADVFSHAYFDGVAWLGYPGNQPPMWYRPIPPLPPAPDKEVQP